MRRSEAVFSRALVAALLLYSMATQAAPVSSAESDILGQVQSQNGPRPTKHFLVSNESQLQAFTLPLRQLRFDNQDKPLIHVGIGGEQNYTFMAHLQPEYVFLFDRDPLVVFGHQIAEVAFAQSSTPEAFVKFYDFHRFKGSTAAIEAYYAQDAEDGNAAVSVSKLTEHLNQYSETYFRQFFKLRQKRSNENFLTSQVLFERAKNLFAEGRVRTLRGDFLHTPILAEIAQASRKLNAEVASLYLSNALDYVIESIPSINNQLFSGVAALPLLNDAHLFATTTHPLQKYIGENRGDWNILLPMREYDGRSWEYRSLPLEKFKAKLSWQRKICNYFLRLGK